MSHRERIGKMLRSYREQRGLTVRQLSDMCGVTYQNINKIELGRYSVGLDVLCRITDVLGVELTIKGED